MTTPNIVVSMPSQIFTLANSFDACANGSIYIGQIDTDPTVTTNQIQVYVENSDGTFTAVSQPITINAGGYPVYAGQVAKFVTIEGQSMAVLDSLGVQQFYFSNLLKYDPDQSGKRLGIPSIDSLRLTLGEAGSIALLNSYHLNANEGGGYLTWVDDTTTLDDGIMFFRVNSSGGWIRPSTKVIQAEWGGVRSDGVECYSNLMSIIGYVTKNGGTCLLPAGKINAGTGKTGNHRITIQWFEGIKPFAIKGFGREATMLFFENINPPARVLPARSSEPSLFLIFGLDSTRYIEFEMAEFTIDYSLQNNQGGKTLGTLGTTDANPYSTGAIAINVSWAKNPKIRDMAITNIYGDCAAIKASFMPVFSDNYVYNVSANQILTDSGTESGDSNGGGCYYAGCYGGEISRNIFWNPRVYTVPTVMPTSGVQVLGTPCGYIGIWCEGNLITQGAGKTPPFTETWLGNMTNTEARTTYQDIRSIQTLINNNIVRGYTIGIKGEATVTLSVKSNTILKCYLPIFPAGVPAIIEDCYIDMQDLGLLNMPQGGYQGFRSYFIASTGIDSQTDVLLRNSSIVYKNCVAHINGSQSAITLNRNDAILDGCIFWFDGTQVGPFIKTPTTAEWRGATIKNCSIYIESTVTNITNAGWFMQDGFSFENNYVVNYSSQEFLLFASRFTYGRRWSFFNNKIEGNIRLVISAEGGNVSNNVFTRSLPFSNPSVVVTSQGKNTHIRHNSFRFPSSQNTYVAEMAGADNVVFSDNLIEVLNAGTTSVVAFINLDTITKPTLENNIITGNVNNLSAFRMSTVRMPIVNSNSGDGTTGALIYGATLVRGPAIIGPTNMFASLSAGQFSDPNLLANLTSLYIPLPGAKINYILPLSGGMEGLVYTTNLGWREFGSIT